ncbi:MAG: hypothetical protein IJ636_05310 [Bacteroidales bacterium]|nr:hypothetical protein [Bacteroidales bacterium]
MRNANSLAELSADKLRYFAVVDNVERFGCRCDTKKAAAFSGSRFGVKKPV